MCSIGGYFCYSEKRPTAETIKTLLNAMEVRGKDATGIAYYNAVGNPIIVKAPLKATEFTKTLKFPNKMPQSMIFHTRATTQGDERNNNNNHPLLTKIGNFPYVHNGMIRNYEEFGIDRTIVDSLAIGNAYEPDDWESLPKKLKGSWTIAMLKPDAIEIWKHTNPISFYIINNILFFASTETILSSITTPKIKHGIKFNNEFGTLEDDNYMLITKENTIINKFTPLPNYTPKNYPTYGYDYGYNYGYDYGYRTPTLFNRTEVDTCSTVSKELNKVNSLLPKKLKAVVCNKCSRIYLEGYKHTCPNEL